MFTVPSSASVASAAYQPSQPSAAASASHTPSDQPKATVALQARWMTDNVDRLFGAEKQGAVERHMATICSMDEAPRRDGHSLCLESFCALKDLAKLSHAGKCTLALGTTMGAMENGIEKEIIAYRFSIEDLVLADRSFAFESRESMLGFARQVERLGLVPDDMRESWCFRDAQLMNRLVDVLPDEIMLHLPEVLNALALGIDDMNVFPDYSGQPHMALAAKAKLLAITLRNQRIDIHFQRETGLDNDGYFLSVRPQIDHSHPGAIAKEPIELYSATVPPGDIAQTVHVLGSAMHLRAKNDVNEYRAVIDSTAALIGRNRDVMTQDPATRSLLTERGDDPTFNRDNYRLLGINAQAQTFSAVFGKQTLVFSNIPSLMGELRGERLQDLLQHGQYRNLNELMATGHKSAADPILRAIVSPLKTVVLSVMEAFDPDGLRNFAALFDSLPVEDTTLGELWNPIPSYVVLDAAAD